MRIVAEEVAALEVRHVKAHQGHPWNEAADKIAKASAAGWLSDAVRMPPNVRGEMSQK